MTCTYTDNNLNAYLCCIVPVIHIPLRICLDASRLRIHYTKLSLSGWYQIRPMGKLTMHFSAHLCSGSPFRFHHLISLSRNFPGIREDSVVFAAVDDFIFFPLFVMLGLGCCAELSPSIRQNSKIILKWSDQVRYRRAPSNPPLAFEIGLSASGRSARLQHRPSDYLSAH